jgi:thioesterase domain-containing protein
VEATTEIKSREPPLSEHGELMAWGSAVVIQPGAGSKRALFCVHAEAGDVPLYHGLAGHLMPDQPVLGLCAPPVGEVGAHQSFEHLASYHVRTVRHVQSSGPYLIVGECTGGSLAYEIARQLRSAGEEVALLALVDAFPLGVPRISRLVPKPAYRVVHRARIFAFHVGNLIRLGRQDRLTYAASKARRARRAIVAKASATLAREAAEGSPQRAFREALAAYRPEPYAGPAVLFRASRMPLGVRAPADLGWGELTTAIEVETLPGYFTTPISEPGVRALARGLTRRLNECNSED